MENQAKQQSVVKTYHYKLITGYLTPSRFIQSGRSGDLIGKNGRAIRYCRNQRSIFLDEQDDRAISTDIEFKDGFLLVTSNQQNLIEFLEEHPSYGVVFDKLDFEQEAEKATNREDRMLRAKGEVLKYIDIAKSKNQKHSPELLAIATEIKNSYAMVHDKSMVELKKIIYDDIDANLDKYYDGEVLKLYTNKTLNYFIAISGLNTGAIRVSADNTQILFEDGTEMMSVRGGVRPVDTLVEYLMSDVGSVYAQKIADAVKLKRSELSPTDRIVRKDTEVQSKMKR